MALAGVCCDGAWWQADEQAVLNDVAARDAWTDVENDAIVADYFAMLDEDVAGRPYNKSERRRALAALIGRGEGSIEYKHQNISAVLKGLGETWIDGYKPAFNFQASLMDAIARWLARRPEWYARAARVDEASTSRVRTITCFGSAPRRRSAMRRHPTNSNKCWRLPDVSTSLPATPAIARLAKRASAVCSITNAPRSRRRTGTISWRRCDGWPISTATGQVMIS